MIMPLTNCADCSRNIHTLNRYFEIPEVFQCGLRGRGDQESLEKLMQLCLNFKKWKGMRGGIIWIGYGRGMSLQVHIHVVFIVTDYFFFDIDILKIRLTWLASNML